MKSVRNVAWCLLVITLITFCAGLLYGASGAPFIIAAGFELIPALFGLAVTNPRLTNILRPYTIRHEAFKRLRIAAYGIIASLVLIAAGIYIDVHRYGWVPVTIGVLSILMHLSVLHER